MKSLAFFFAFVFTMPLAQAQRPPPLNDPFLDHFVGNWRVERKMRSRTVQTHVHAEWVLKHHFIELHYGGGGTESDYEAFVYFGFDESKKAYVCHWVDVFGANESLLGYGKLDDKLLNLEFRFGGDKEGITNNFTFNPGTQTWTSHIEQVEKGEWKTFADEKWTRDEPNK